MAIQSNKSLFLTTLILLCELCLIEAHNGGDGRSYYGSTPLLVVQKDAGLKAASCRPILHEATHYRNALREVPVQKTLVQTDLVLRTVTRTLERTLTTPVQSFFVTTVVDTLYETDIKNAFSQVQNIVTKTYYNEQLFTETYTANQVKTVNVPEIVERTIDRPVDMLKFVHNTVTVTEYQRYGKPTVITEYHTEYTPYTLTTTEYETKYAPATFFVHQTQHVTNQIPGAYSTKISTLPESTVIICQPKHIGGSDAKSSSQNAPSGKGAGNENVSAGYNYGPGISSGSLVLGSSGISQTNGGGVGIGPVANSGPNLFEVPQISPLQGFSDKPVANSVLEPFGIPQISPVQEFDIRSVANSGPGPFGVTQINPEQGFNVGPVANSDPGPFSVPLIIPAQGFRVRPEANSGPGPSGVPQIGFTQGFSVGPTPNSGAGPFGVPLSSTSQGFGENPTTNFIQRAPLVGSANGIGFGTAPGASTASSEGPDGKFSINAGARGIGAIGTTPIEKTPFNAGTGANVNSVEGRVNSGTAANTGFRSNNVNLGASNSNSRSNQIGQSGIGQQLIQRGVLQGLGRIRDNSQNVRLADSTSFDSQNLFIQNDDDPDAFSTRNNDDNNDTDDFSTRNNNDNNETVDLSTRNNNSIELFDSRES